MMKLAIASAVFLVALPASFSLPAPADRQRALFFCEQRNNRVGWIAWPPAGCTTDADCKAINGSYCMNDKSKTAPFFCHTPVVTLADKLDKPVGIARINDEIFYTQDDQASGDTFWPMKAIASDGSNPRTVVEKLLDPQGMGSDGTGKVYYTEHHGQRVGVVNADGTDRKVLKQFNASDFPGDVKVDTVNGKVFATLGGALSTGNKIISMNLDGSDYTVLKSDLVRGYGLTLDVENKRIFYVQGGHGGFIGSLSYDGKEGPHILDGLDYPGMIDYDAPRKLIVYSITGVPDGVIRTITTDGSAKGAMIFGGFAPMGVVFGYAPKN